MSNFDDIVTDPWAMLAAAEAAIAATDTEPVPIAGEFVVLASGGSSGERGLFVFDTDVFAEYGLTFTRHTTARPRDIGEPPGGLDIALVAASSPIHASGCVPRIFDAGPVRFRRVPVTLPLTEIVDRLNELQPHALMGYPSMVARLARERSAGRLRISPVSVTTASETLRPDQRAVITAAFGAVLVNTFGASEGLVGVSPPDDPVVTFASDCCIAEPVDENDRPVPPGTSSAAVLVTNLFNHTQPLIRYRLEDRFLEHPPSVFDGHFRADVEGRTTDVLRFNEVEVHPHVISSPLAHNAAVGDYQVTQTLNGIDVAVVAQCVDFDALIDQLAGALRAAGLDSPDVRVTAVDDIARDPQTGKRRQFVPLPA